MKTKPVSFNLDNPHEKALFEFVERIPKGKFAAWAKRLMQDEYRRMSAQKRPADTGRE